MTRTELADYLKAHFGDLLSPLETGRYDLLVQVAPDKLKEVCLRLRDDANLKFDYLGNAGGIDDTTQLAVIYNLASTVHRHRLDLKLFLPYDNAEIDSLQEIWPGINWYEREIWELYGINVRNHGNLTRFLLPDDWNQGHPMRKNWDAPDFVRLPEFNV